MSNLGALRSNLRTPASGHWSGLRTPASAHWSGLRTPASALPVSMALLCVARIGFADPVPNWQPAQAQLSQLTDHSSVTTYTIQVPKGAQAQHQGMDTPTATETQFVWTVGKALNILAKVTVEKDANPVPELAAALDTFENETVNTCIDPVRTKKETGSVDGLTATRDRFTFTMTDAAHTKMAGFNYAVKTGSTIVIAGAITADATKDKDLPLAEASVLTLIKSIAKDQQQQAQ